MKLPSGYIRNNLISPPLRCPPTIKHADIFSPFSFNLSFKVIAFADKACPRSSTTPNSVGTSSIDFRPSSVGYSIASITCDIVV